MKKSIWIAQLVSVLVALVFVVFAIGALYTDEAFVYRVLNFLILISPGILIVLVFIFFRNFYKLSGLMYLGLGIIFFFFFRPYKDFEQDWPVLLMIILPLITIGIIHLLYKDKTKIEIK
ncbi:hypothetical protein HF295_08300 [Hujiaoplasma nucleasis]|uniref:DUF7670 domain-containing protein n=1 Tax=Hujiaoplasma nucleasis TaxID=2725268 RepID=A0A7L6N8H7_9MOLU|nr:hypothetical protein [Hujiaoplasma nucleasis]QLY40854.1 hypothetical protein HF295_08300 [Hujiaoplasma nucleasis]